MRRQDRPARIVIDIETAAKLTVSEENRDGLRFRPHRHPDNSPHGSERGGGLCMAPDD